MAGGGAWAWSLAGGASSLRAAEPATESTNAKVKKRALRLAHLTDIHVQPELGAPQGMAACLHHAQQLADKPELILTGGDSVMESFGATKERTRTQWDVWRKVLKDDCSLPVESCIGNHDVWGWDQAHSGAADSDPLYGKKWAVDELRIADRYRSFDSAGWHFVVLDSTHPGATPGTYTARLDGEQFDWLARDLAAVPQGVPVLVLSHIPILSAASFLDGDNAQSGNWIVPGAWMHVDVRKLIDLFHKTGKVKLCLSGHLHLVDRVDYDGVTYLCNGAVCGGWWKGNNQECDEGYGVVDLFDDGSFAAQYVGFGWQPVG